ncbi:MAG: hypothetical protein NZ874_03515, partial [Fimbriimonadales bacterium]|nr:hypothetical protein [Fimbriimonadales bacterium]
MSANRSAQIQDSTGRWLIVASILLLLGGGWIVWRALNPPPVEKRVHNPSEIRVAHPKTGEQTVIKPPFQLADCRVEEYAGGTRLILSLQALNRDAIAKLDQSVYVVGIHTNDYLIVYAHNSGALWFRTPAIPKDDTLLVLDGRSRIVAQGRFLPEYDRNQITVEVPLRVSLRDVALVRFRYLPSADQARRMPKS